MPSIVAFPRIIDPRGSLSFAQGLPFEIKRVYWVYNIAEQAIRGGHAHKNLRRILIPITGGFRITVNGVARTMDAPDVGILIEPMEWLEMLDFSYNSAFMVLASAEYLESDYIRSKDEWTTLRAS